jgi:aldose sugar dehydrogenase
MKHSFFYFIALMTMGCNSQEKRNDITLSPESSSYTFETVIDGIEIPWGMAWLPDGTMLVTEKSGSLYHIKNKKKTVIGSMPAVNSRGQGGLLDVAVHPDYSKNGWIYIAYAADGPEGSNTIIIRAKFQNEVLTEIKEIYKTNLEKAFSRHFGCRIVFDNDGYLYFTVGERGNHDQNPQDITRDGGKVYRLHDDGRIPADNPFVGKPNAKEAIWSFGHRNQQGMIKNPITGEIWTHEHGPQGGDEINIIKKGANYGWPIITYGIDYDNSIISNLTKKEGMEQPLYYWVPSIAPSGMTFVSSDIYPAWKGHLLVGSLKFQYLELVKLKENKVIARQKIATDIGRLRNVAQGPDGYIYMGVEGKGIIKIIPN